MLEVYSFLSKDVICDKSTFAELICACLKQGRVLTSCNNHTYIAPQSATEEAMQNNSFDSRNLKNQSSFPASMTPHRHTNIRTIPPGQAHPNINQLTSAFRFPYFGLPTEPIVARTFLVFDQSGDRTSLVFSSINTPIQDFQPTIPEPKRQVPRAFLKDMVADNSQTNRSNEAIVSDGNVGEEMHEDTEEIDALLYSDSEDEEETSTDRSPLKLSSIDEVVANLSLPAKRKRSDDEIDPALLDTASSAVKPHLQNPSDSDKSSWVKSSSAHIMLNEKDESRASGPSKKLKRDHIREALGVLRRIVPGAKGKDTTAILDEAIRYLRSFKLKSKIPEATLVQY